MAIKLLRKSYDHFCFKKNTFRGLLDFFLILLPPMERLAHLLSNFYKMNIMVKLALIFTENFKCSNTPNQLNQQLPF